MKRQEKNRTSMSAIQRFRLRNTLLVANGIANIVGVTVVFYLARRVGLMGFTIDSRLYAAINLVFLPFSFALPIIATLIYERPIRRYLTRRWSGLPVPDDLMRRVQRRLLNEPFFLIGLDAAVWIAAAITYAIYFHLLHLSQKTVLGAFLLNVQVGIVTVTVAFFVIEFFLQRRLTPYFFPFGGLSKVSQTVRIRIRTRLIAFLAATNLIPLWTTARGSWAITQSIRDADRALAALQTMIWSHAVIFFTVGVWLTFLVSNNLARPLNAILMALQRIGEGQFDQRVAVTSNDELGYVGDAVNEMASGLEERAFIKETFGKYVSREIRDEVLARNIPLDGAVVDVSVLFADLRNFTPLVEHTGARQVVRIINRYFEEMEAIIRGQGGLVLQFIGDEIEAVFGAPLPLDDHATRAVTAAMEMDARLKKVNHTLVDQGHAPLRHGIGIHSGTVVAANIGSPSRLSYALVGDTVNLASRLQNANKQHGTSIIVSAETHRRLTRPIPLRSLPATMLKGKQDPVALFGQ